MAALAIYLASQSPRRRELLQQIGVPHQVISVAVTETPFPGEAAADYVQRLACEKAQAGLISLKRDHLPIKPVLGADTIVVCNDVILEKPRDQHHFGEMLARLSGASHQVMTAVALVDETRTSIKLSITDVVFRQLDTSEIDAYWHTGEPRDKAGGYAIQGLGAVFVREIKGSYTGVVGLPIEQTVELFQEFGVSWWQQ